MALGGYPARAWSARPCPRVGGPVGWNPLQPVGFPMRLLLCATLLLMAVPVDAALTFQRLDGSTVDLSGARIWAWCGPWEEGLVPAPSVHILAAELPSTLYWLLDGVRADIILGQPNPFPNVWTWPHAANVDVFVLDPVNGNELTTGLPGASGSITFTQLDCDPGGTVAFSIDATLVSEIGGPTMTVQGTFAATITGQPVQTGHLSWGIVKARF